MGHISEATGVVIVWGRTKKKEPMTPQQRDDKKERKEKKSIQRRGKENQAIPRQTRTRSPFLERKKETSPQKDAPGQSNPQKGVTTTPPKKSTSLGATCNGAKRRKKRGIKSRGENRANAESSRQTAKKNEHAGKEQLGHD